VPNTGHTWTGTALMVKTLAGLTQSGFSDLLIHQLLTNKQSSQRIISRTEKGTV
jgi:hypothetical protein